MRWPSGWLIRLQAPPLPAPAAERVNGRRRLVGGHAVHHRRTKLVDPALQWSLELQQQQQLAECG